MTLTAPSLLFSLAGWFFGILFLFIGFVNSFWGNDPYFGLFIVVVSFAFYPPVNPLLKAKIGFSIPAYLKIALALFILWAAVGVGELFDKVDMMMLDFRN